ncbi:MAG: hypothetical protein ACR2MG_10520 [Pyrinomonadaceae bacterium]
MATGEKDKKQINAEELKADSLWRKPITLDAFEDDDPLATLYRGREVGESTATDDNQPKLEVTKKFQQRSIKKTTETAKIEYNNKQENVKTPPSPKVTESELKSILKIKSESFHFTDIREILRGKSFDIYAYLRFLSGETGVCKIRHLDLMKKLDISRPTLFKQGEWLTRLSLIEKRNVPGDHLGTSYKVHRLEEVLPVSESLVKQLESHIENLQEISDEPVLV